MKIRVSQRLPEQLMDEKSNPKFTFAPVAKWVFVQNYWYENMMSFAWKSSDFHDFHGKCFAQALALQMETKTVEVKVCIHSFLFYENVVFLAQAEYSYFSADFSLKTFLYYS